MTVSRSRPNATGELGVAMLKNRQPTIQQVDTWMKLDTLITSSLASGHGAKKLKEQVADISRRMEEMADKGRGKEDSSSAADVDSSTAIVGSCTTLVIDFRWLERTPPGRGFVNISATMRSPGR